MQQKAKTCCKTYNIRVYHLKIKDNCLQRAESNMIPFLNNKNGKQDVEKTEVKYQVK